MIYREPRYSLCSGKNEKGEQLTVLDLERNVVNGRELAELLGQGVDLNAIHGTTCL